MIRAFIAAAIDPQIVREVAAAIAQLKPCIAGVRWTTPTNFHLTLKFLGNIEESAVEPIGERLRARLRLFQRFTINVKGLGVFPGPRRPRVLWVGLTAAQLAPLAAQVDSALQPLGFVPETKQFTPHLTIGRWRETSSAPDSLAPELERWQAHEFGQFRVEEIKLIQSVLRPEGASYRELITVPLSV